MGGLRLVAELDGCGFHKSRDVTLDPLAPAERKQLTVLLEKLVDLHSRRLSPTVSTKVEAGD